MKTILNLMLYKKFKKNICLIIECAIRCSNPKGHGQFQVSQFSCCLFHRGQYIREKKHGFGNFGSVNRRFLFRFGDVRIVTSFHGLIFFLFSFSFFAWIGWFNPHSGRVTDKTETGTYFLVWATSWQTIDNSKTSDIHEIFCRTLNKTKLV